MLFGALFLSMPLAIIGNEYDKAWSQIQDEIAEERRIQQGKAAKQEIQAQQAAQDAQNAEDNNVPKSPRNAHTDAAEKVASPPSTPLLPTFADKKKVVSQYSCVTICDQIRVTLNQVQRDVKHHNTHVSHHVLTSLCELKAWISSLIINTEDQLRTTAMLSNRAVAHLGEVRAAAPVPASTAPRRFSIVHGGGRLVMRDLNPSPAAVPNYRNNAVVPLSEPQSAISIVPGFYHSAGPSSKPEAGLVNIQEGDSDDSESSLSLSDLDDDTDLDQVLKKKPNVKTEPITFSKPTLKKKVSSLSSQSISSDSDNEQATPHQAFADPASADNLSNTLTLTNNTPSAMIAAADGESESSSDDDSQNGKEMHQDQNVVVRDADPVKVPSRPIRSRTSIYVKMLTVIGVQDKVSRRRTVSEEFINKMEQVTQDPTSWRSRVWILLELPHSSREARALQLLIIFLICLSIFILYTQTIVNLSAYGEDGRLCGRLLQKYCEDKYDRNADPGCFVQGIAGPTKDKLKFECDSFKCFGHGLNFGSYHTNMTCVNATVVPFQSKSELEYLYGKPYLFTPREDMHRINPVCSRLECIDNSETYFDGRPLWTATEFLTNIIFTVELVLRVVVADSFRTYYQDKMNVFDVLAVFPFYTELVSTAGAGFGALDFSILSSSPEPIFFVTMRSLKVRLFLFTSCN